MGHPLTLPSFTSARDTIAVEQRLRNVFTVIKENEPEGITLTDDPSPALEAWEPS